MSRTRTQGSIAKSWQKNSDYNPDGSSAGSTTYNSASGAAGTYRSITDVVTKGYKKLSAQGHIMMNPLSLTYDTRSTSFDTLSFGPHSLWGTRKVEGTLACQWSIPPTRPSWFATRIADAKSRTLLRAHSKVAQEDFQGLVTVAEASKTASMIARPFGSALALLERIAARRARLVQRGATLAVASASAWLEYRLGWRPLLFDIEGIWTAYHKNTLYYDKPVRLVARAGDHDIKWFSPPVVTQSVQPGLTSVTMASEYDHQAKVTSGVLYELFDGTLEAATARRMGMRLSDVPAAVWEIVPLSFVVDRFVDIGTWLQAITPKPGVRILGSWSTTIDKQINTNKVREARIYVATSPATTYVQSGGTFREEIHAVTRVANPSLPPLPTVNYRDLNLSQQLDHAALIVAKLAGFKVRTS